MKRHIYLSAILALLVTGCGTTYVAPKDGPVAKLVLPVIGFEFKWGASTGGGVRVAAKGIEGCGQFSKNLKPESSDAKNQSITIPANTDVFVGLTKSIGNSACTVNTLFSAQANKEYLANIEVLSSVCIVTVKEKISENSLIPVKLTQAYASAWDGIKVCDAKNKL